MKDDQLNRLDDRTAERLLQGDPGAIGATGADELRLLSALLEAAAAPAPGGSGSAPTAEEDAAAAAFRLGLHTAARSRRRWLRRPLRAGAGVVTAAMLFGGVAVAVQTGAVRLPLSGRPGQSPGAVHGSAGAPAGASASVLPGLPPGGTGYSGAPAGKPGGPPSSSSSAGQGETGSLRSLCTAYQSAQQGHGTIHPADALRRLTEAAGSETAIAGYCARLLGSDGSGAARGGSSSNGNGTGKTPAGGASPSKGPK